MYWNPTAILPYQRNFNFINSERSIGKTYSTELFMLDKAINKAREFIYLVRTKTVKDSGAFEKAFEKVINEKFHNFNFDFTADSLYLDNKRLGYCIALSEAVDIKRNSYPNVKYMFHDEYMLEPKHFSKYVTGWNEPDLLLNIYHTVDREEDRVIVFLMGNNTNFYNPYHLHPAFNIPKIEKGGIWYNDNVLFQYADSSVKLKAKKSKCKFLNMIKDTDYGNYALDGLYADDALSFISERSKKAKHIFNLMYMGTTYGVWTDYNIGKIFIDDKYDPSCNINYALTLDDHSENTLLTKTKSAHLLQWLAQGFKNGNVYYTAPKIKITMEKAISMLL